MLIFAPTTVEAFEPSGGVSLGGIFAGAKPRLAVSPHAAIAWRLDGRFLFAVHEMCSILPAINEHGAGVYNQTAAALGVGWKDVNFSVGPSLSIYSMPVCTATVCARVIGLSPGGHAQASFYFAGRFGLTVSANFGWIGGSSGLLPGSIAATVVAGPVLRWSAK